MKAFKINVLANVFFGNAMLVLANIEIYINFALYFIYLKIIL